MLEAVVEVDLALHGAGNDDVLVPGQDALHIAVAETLPDLEAFVTYDGRQGDAARLMGMQVVSPGSA